MHTEWWWVWGLSTVLISVACNDETPRGRAGSSASIEAGEEPADAATPKKVSCGGDGGPKVECEVPVEAIFTSACCTEAGECGLTVGDLIEECVPASAYGGVDKSCADFSFEAMIHIPTNMHTHWPRYLVPGCCAPSNECGGIVAGVGERCVATSSFGGSIVGVSCTRDPANDCAQVLSIAECDGPEDCPEGKVCAATLRGYSEADAFYIGSGCVDATSLRAEGGSGVFSVTSPIRVGSELCNADSTCTVPTYSCMLAATRSLPDFLPRCRDFGSPAPDDLPIEAGKIRCGTDSCDSKTEKCCLARNQAGWKEPYCLPVDQECSCNPPQG